MDLIPRNFPQLPDEALLRMPPIPTEDPLTGKTWTKRSLCAYVRYARPWLTYSVLVPWVLAEVKKRGSEAFSPEACQSDLAKVPGFIVSPRGLAVAVDQMLQQQQRRGLPPTPLAQWPVGANCWVPYPDDRLGDALPMVGALAKSFVEAKGYVEGGDLVKEWEGPPVNGLHTVCVQALRFLGYCKRKRRINKRQVHAFFPAGDLPALGRPKKSDAGKSLRSTTRLSADSMRLLREVKQARGLDSLDEAVHVLTEQMRQMEGKTLLQEKAEVGEVAGLWIEKISTWWRVEEEASCT